MAEPTPSTQRGLTVICALRDADAQEAVAQELRRNDPASKDLLGSIKTLHFLSWFVVGPEDGGRPGTRHGPPLLVLEANFDGGGREFLSTLVADEPRREFLDRIYADCRDYPGQDASAMQVVSYMEAHSEWPDVYFAACPGHDVDRILAEQGRCERIVEVVRKLDAPRGRRSEHLRRIWCELTPQEREEIRRVPREAFRVRYSLREHPWKALLTFVGLPLAVLGACAIFLMLLHSTGLPLWSWLVPPPSVARTTGCAAWIVLGVALLVPIVYWMLLVAQGPKALTGDMRLRIHRATASRLLRATLSAAPAAFLLICAIAGIAWTGGFLLEAAAYLAVALLLLAAALGVGLVFISLAEFEDRVDGLRWDCEKVSRCCARENDGTQNHFVSVTAIKPGRLRLATLRVVLGATQLLAGLFHDRRGLAGIASIHFARWQILEDGRRLLFVTNYDGGWSGYLGEFVAYAASGLTAIWSNTGGFPRAFYLFGDGARDEQRFKCYARASQVETLFWYRGYPGLSVGATRRNAAICGDLARFAESLAPGTEPMAEAELDAFLRRFAAPRAGP